jgi:hypothetical protein
MRFDRVHHQGPAASGWLVLSVLTLAVHGITSPVHAEEPTNPFNSMFGLFGGKPDQDETDAIDYRPRAPLVVPPTRDLPEPKEAVRDPAWPKDADANAQRRAALDSRRRVPHSNPTAGTGTVPTASPAKAPEPAKPDEHEECLLNDTGPRSCFNVFHSVFGVASTDAAVKPGTEPERKLLIEPPPGYRTATVSPRTPADKARTTAAEQGPFDSFLEVFGMKKASDN